MANVDSFEDYFEIKTIGDIDWCYKSIKLNNQYQFVQPRNKFVIETNHGYGEWLIWLPPLVILVVCCCGMAIFGNKYNDD